MTEKLEKHYDEMWAGALKQFRLGQCNTDAFIDSLNDARRGITLLARPTGEIETKINNFKNNLKEADPDQYYYPSEDLHLTILSIISCYSGFRLESINSIEYSEVIERCLANPIEVQFHGMTASPSAVMVQGFPERDDLNLLRDKLREEFNDSVLESSIDSRYKINTAHFTIARFRKPIKNIDKFIETLSSFRDYSFGKMTINKLDLVYNDWYQRERSVKELDTFTLGKSHTSL
ncbi:MAG: mutarotase [Reichenbachiella sp.]|uniref:mutarotase n=1 Tax=Reichenbachiella sp. TaxID=2184521 RepID=UPI003265F66A